MPVPRNNTNEFIVESIVDDEIDLDEFDADENYTLPNNASQIIFNNTRLTDESLRQIANILIDNRHGRLELSHNNAETREEYAQALCARGEYCEIIANYLTVNDDIPYSTFCEITDVLEQIYDFQRAGDLDGYEAICLALTNEL